MARPLKHGIDYFPLDTHMEESVEFIEAKHGLCGFAVIIKLWQKIYSDKGYYIPWSERSARLFAKNNGVEYDQLREIVEDCLAEGIFHKALYEQFGVLTSKGIQKRYVHASTRRSSIEMELKLTINGVSACKNVVIVDTMLTETPQRKVKETKEKEKDSVTSAEETAPPDVTLLPDPPPGPDIYRDTFAEFWETYPRKNGKRIGKVDTEAEFRKLKPEEIPLALIAVKNYAASERVKKGWGIRDPLRFFKKAGEKQPFWLEWQEPEVPEEAASGTVDESGIDYEAVDRALAKREATSGRG